LGRIDKQPARHELSDGSIRRRSGSFRGVVMAIARKTRAPASRPRLQRPN
jgi:hypothetical protein